MNIVFILKNITLFSGNTTLYFSANEHSYKLPYLRRPISDELLWIYNKDTAKPYGLA